MGILDLDLTGPSIPRLLGVEGAKVTQAPGGWKPVVVHEATAAAEASPVQAGTPSFSIEPATPMLDEGAGNGLEEACARLAVDAANGHIREAAAENAENEASSPHPSTPRQGKLVAMSLGFLLQSRGDAVVWRGPKKTAMVRQFLTDVLWGQLDYLLIDTPPGTSDEHISLVESLHANPAALAKLRGAIIVTTPQAVATADVKKELNFCKKTAVDVVGVVENMAGYVCPCCGEVTNVFSKGGGEVMAKEWGVRFLGGVPIDGTWGAVSEGLAERNSEGDVVTGSERKEQESLVSKYSKCMSAPIFKEITGRVLDICEGREMTPIAPAAAAESS